MRGTSREVFTVQKDRRDLLAPDFPELPHMQSLRCALLSLPDHPKDETATRMRDHSPRTETRQLSQQRGRTAPPLSKIEEGKHIHRPLAHRAATAMGPRPGPRSAKPSPRQLPSLEHSGASSPPASPQGVCGRAGTGNSRLG